jgi:hypothetical protein
MPTSIRSLHQAYTSCVALHKNFVQFRADIGEYEKDHSELDTHYYSQQSAGGGLLPVVAPSGVYLSIRLRDLMQFLEQGRTLRLYLYNVKTQREIETHFDTKDWYGSKREQVNAFFR